MRAGRPAPQPGQGHGFELKGRRSPGSPRPLGVPSPRVAPAGLGARRGLWDRRQLFCTALRVPSSSLRSLLQTRPQVSAPQRLPQVLALAAVALAAVALPNRGPVVLCPPLFRRANLALPARAERPRKRPLRALR